MSSLVKFGGGEDRSLPFIRDGRERKKKGHDADNVTDFVDVSWIGTDLTYVSRPSHKNRRVSDLDIEWARFEHVESAKWQNGT